MQAMKIQRRSRGSSTLSGSRRHMGGGWWTARTGLFTPGKEARYPLTNADLVLWNRSRPPGVRFLSSSTAVTLQIHARLANRRGKRRTSRNCTIHQHAQCRFLRWPIVDMNVVPEGLYALYSAPSNHGNTIFVYSWMRKAPLISRFILLQKLDKYSRKLTGNIMHVYPRSEVLGIFCYTYGDRFILRVKKSYGVANPPPISSYFRQ